ncbi:hypothetical protein RJ639_021915 [Escallonia herrerae]|uniref:Uncharacterized protein n=1 Tax=Escallonia herrerae TaxID=1293975 RepID=A0AA89AG06_9ASTE|nr:hypothetical protein RJ639_021915 [Escallonia herrerae]
MAMIHMVMVLAWGGGGCACADMKRRHGMHLSGWWKEVASFVKDFDWEGKFGAEAKKVSIGGQDGCVECSFRSSLGVGTLGGTSCISLTPNNGRAVNIRYIDPSASEETVSVAGPKSLLYALEVAEWHHLSHQYSFNGLRQVLDTASVANECLEDRLSKGLRRKTYGHVNWKYSLHMLKLNLGLYLIYEDSVVIYGIWKGFVRPIIWDLAVEVEITSCCFYQLARKTLEMLIDEFLWKALEEVRLLIKADDSLVKPATRDLVFLCYLARQFRTSWKPYGTLSKPIWDAKEEANLIHRNDQQQFLATVDFLSNYGMPTLISSMQEAATDVLKGNAERNFAISNPLVSRKIGHWSDTGIGKQD